MRYRISVEEGTEWFLSARMAELADLYDNNRGCDSGKNRYEEHKTNFSLNAGKTSCSTGNGRESGPAVRRAEVWTTYYCTGRYPKRSRPTLVSQLYRFWALCI